MNVHQQSILTPSDALRALQQCWLAIVDECRLVLGSELHYQAVVYHCLRASVRTTQLGMNVKMRIDPPTTERFRELAQRRQPGFQGVFEPIPDVVIFSADVAGDWRRRRYETTLREMLLAIEVKASERSRSRLLPGEIETDIFKLAAHRQEVLVRGGDFVPVVMVIDTAPDDGERMSSYGLERARDAASSARVCLFYLSPSTATVDLNANAG